MPKQKTSKQILDTARDLLVSDGLAGLSFDAIARKLGLSKQAVLYWFPTKHDLLAAMFLPCLEAEAEVAEKSVEMAFGPDETIAAYIEAIAEFHLEDLPRFRMMYLLPQTMRQKGNNLSDRDLLDKIHPVTDRVYGALSENLEGDRKNARQEAVAIHSAILGLVLMIGLADEIDDRLKHPASDLIEALVRLFQKK